MCGRGGVGGGWLLLRCHVCLHPLFPQDFWGHGSFSLGDQVNHGGVMEAGQSHRRPLQAVPVLLQVTGESPALLRSVLSQHSLLPGLQLNAYRKQQRPSGLIRLVFYLGFNHVAVWIRHLLAVYCFEVITRPLDALKANKIMRGPDKVINSDCVNKIIPLCSQGLVLLRVSPQWRNKAKTDNTAWVLINAQPGCRATCEAKSCSCWILCRKLTPLQPWLCRRFKDTWSVVMWNLAGGGAAWPRSILHHHTHWSLFFKMAKTHPLQETFRMYR